MRLKETVIPSSDPTEGGHGLALLDDLDSNFDRSAGQYNETSAELGPIFEDSQWSCFDGGP